MKKLSILLVFVLVLPLLAACASGYPLRGTVVDTDDNYRTYYQIFVYSFADSDGDGIGDINGIIDKLDYLNDGNDNTDTDLGITGIWLTPIFPSPTYHKYNSGDYTAIDPDFGTMEDMELLIDLCHQRGIKIIIDLMLNHSGYNHQWFVKARTAANSGNPQGHEYAKYYNYYNFRNSGGTGYWNNGIGASGLYYEGQFESQMPDLNLANQDVRDEFDAIAKFWLDKGIDGFRLDAVKFFFGNDRSNSPDLIAKNKEVLSWFNGVVKGYNPDAYIVCEMWDSIQSVLGNYYDGSGVDSFFNFVLGGNLNDQNGANIMRSVLSKGNTAFNAYSNAAFYANYKNMVLGKNPQSIDAMFITNHDNNRAASQMSGNVDNIKLAASILLTLPGNPFLYYGEELGTTGAGIDENKRVPMTWSADGKDGYTTSGPPNMTVYEPPVSVQEQQQDDNSILNHYKRLIRERQENPALARGVMAALDTGNKKVMAYTVTYEGTVLYVLHNMSDESVTIQLDNVTALEAYFNGTVQLKGNTVTMPAYSSTIIK